MRYGKNENTYILGQFNSGDTVTIDVYRLSDNNKVVDGGSCSEVGATGVFKYLFSQSITQKEEFLFIMSNGVLEIKGKIIFGGYLDDMKDRIDENLDAKITTRSSHSPEDVNNLLENEHGAGSWEGADITGLENTCNDIKAKTDTINWDDVIFIKDIEGGKREIINNQEIFYKADNQTEVARFNLYDRSGNPAERNVYKRERV